ncbi:MAG: PAS domain S-box protein [Planctomycetota bacterium]|nr:PAS domain S-box protein [Planctomycetota bacterium]
MRRLMRGSVVVTAGLALLGLILVRTTSHPAIAAGVFAVLLLSVAVSKWLVIYHPAMNLLEARTRELIAREADATRLAAIARRTSNLVVVCDRDGRITWVNAAFERLTGYMAAEVIGRKPGGFLQGPETDRATVERIREAVQRREPVTAELLNYSKSGQSYWLRLDIAPLCDDAGAFVGFMAIETDITQERRTRDAIRGAEAFLRSSIDAMDAHIAIVDEQGTIITVNQAWRSFAERNDGTASCVEGSNYLAVCDALTGPRGTCTDAVDVARSLRAVLSGKSVDRPHEYACHSPNEQRWFQVSVKGFEREGKHFAVVAHQNVTEAKHAQLKMLEERERLAILVEHTPAAIAMFDAEMRLLAVSRRWQRDFGLAGQNVVGRSLAEVLPEMPTGWRDLQARCAGGRIASCEDEVWRPAGSREERHVQWEVRPWVDEAGGVRCSLMSCVDTTADRQREAELQRLREVAEQANRAKTAFLANMSHEIRTPLTAILGYADLLEDDGDLDLAPDSRLEKIATIRRAGGHLLNVVNDILDISKIEADRMSIESVETSLEELLRSVVTLNEPRAKEKGIRLVLETIEPLPVHVRTDPTRLRQILMNLVGNAIKFTERGSVTLRVSAEPSSDGASLQLRCAVQDTGVGLSAAEAGRLFQTFTQADESVTRRHGGTGLGLVIARRLAQLMHGDVVLERSERGLGSTFVATVRVEVARGVAAGEPTPTTTGQTEATPHLTSTAATTQTKDVVAMPSRERQPASTAVSTAASTAAISLQRLNARIVLAEDGPDNQKLIAFHLRKAGASVDVADNGKIALELIDAAAARGTPYDLLVSDMQMPEMDGYTLARVMRARGNRMPIIALTAHAMPEDRIRCIEAGCNEYAAKPIDKTTLVSLCAAQLRAGGPMTCSSAKAA